MHHNLFGCVFDQAHIGVFINPVGTRFRSVSFARHEFLYISPLVSDQQARKKAGVSAEDKLPVSIQSNNDIRVISDLVNGVVILDR